MNSSPENSVSNDSLAPDPERVCWLREQIAELKRRWPAHSVPVGMLQCLDDLEEALELELRKGDQQIGR